MDHESKKLKRFCIYPIPIIAVAYSKHYLKKKRHVITKTDTESQIHVDICLCLWNLISVYYYAKTYFRDIFTYLKELWRKRETGKERKGERSICCFTPQWLLSVRAEPGQARNQKLHFHHSPHHEWRAWAIFYYFSKVISTETEPEMEQPEQEPMLIWDA